MRRILIELQLEGELEEDYDDVCDRLTVEDMIGSPPCGYEIKERRTKPESKKDEILV